MKKFLLPLALSAVLIMLHSCKSKTEPAATTDAATGGTTATAPAKEENSTAPKTYTVTVTPDSVSLGKNKEALIKIKNLKAVQLTNTDGQVTGIEMSYDIEATNRRQLHENSVYINPNDFRLQLDNGTKITHDNYNTVSIDAQSTNSSADNKFKLPAGTKPVALNLYFDETSAQVKLDIK